MASDAIHHADGSDFELRAFVPRTRREGPARPRVLLAHAGFPTQRWRLELPESVREENNCTWNAEYGPMQPEEVRQWRDGHSLVFEEQLSPAPHSRYFTGKTALLRIKLVPQSATLGLGITMRNTCDEPWHNASVHLCFWHLDAHDAEHFFVLDRVAPRRRRHATKREPEIDFDPLRAVALPDLLRSNGRPPELLSRSRCYAQRQGTFLFTGSGLTEVATVAREPNQFDFWLVPGRQSTKLDLIKSDPRTEQWDLSPCRLYDLPAAGGGFVCEPHFNSIVQPDHSTRLCVHALPIVLFGFDRVHWLLHNRFKPCTDLSVHIGDLAAGESVTRRGAVYLGSGEPRSMVERFYRDFPMADGGADWRSRGAGDAG